MVHFFSRGSISYFSNHCSQMPDKVIGRRMNMLVHTQRNAVCLQWGRVGGGNMVHEAGSRKSWLPAPSLLSPFPPSYLFQDSSSQSSGENMICSLKSSPAEAQNGFVPFIWLKGAPCSMLKLILERESEATMKLLPAGAHSSILPASFDADLQMPEGVKGERNLRTMRGVVM